jgi:hypothetical protein
VRSGRFPASVKLGPRITAWRVEDIRARWVTASSFVLFDSSGHSRVSVGCCRMAYERSLRSRREHVIEAGGIFRLSVA